MNKKCSLCHVVTLVKDYKLKGICANCCREDKKRVGRPELVLKRFLQEYHSWELPMFIHNQTDPRTRSSTTKCRLDFRAVCDNYDVGLEVDENQHRYNSLLSELVRMQLLVKAAEGKPIMMFRVNPDRFENIHGVCKSLTGAEYQDTLKQRFSFLLDRVKTRMRKTDRRIKASGGTYKPPILYLEKICYDTDSQNPRYQEVTVRQYADAKAIQAEIVQTLRRFWCDFYHGVQARSGAPKI